MTYISALIFILVGAFKEFIIISILIIIHELGHAVGAKIVNIEVEKIIIYPLGGLTKLNMPMNTNSYKEFFILAMGPLFQIIAKLILITIFKNDINLINTYHLSILSFNLLPIYPLDGGKLLNIFFEKILPLKKSLKIVIQISFLTTLIIFLLKEKKINIIVMTLLLLVLIIKENKTINYKYNKFLLERYLNNYKFKKTKIISTKNNFYKGKKHLIKDNNTYYYEKDYLEKILQKS